MTELRPLFLRLRPETFEALKAEKDVSSHRSYSSLADELLTRQLESNRRHRLMQREMDINAGRIAADGE
jgi:hypothetical protein